jgi:phosphoribosylformylglycinamidine synthase
MTDLTLGRASLSSFSGIAFVGGFSNADVLDSAKGWAGSIKFNPGLLEVSSENFFCPNFFSKYLVKLF